MTVADVGAGFGAWTVTMAKRIGPSGRVYATDIGAEQLAALRDTVVRERLENVTVLEGSAGSANLPDGCCDAVFLRDVYQHLTQPEEFAKSVVAALKPGGRLAIIDFEPESGSKIPPGVPVDRGGHGISPSLIISELSAAGLSRAQTMTIWPPESTGVRPYFLVLFRRAEWQWNLHRCPVCGMMALFDVDLARWIVAWAATRRIWSSSELRRSVFRPVI
jgi:SAM-dependent methyltransferase